MTTFTRTRVKVQTCPNCGNRFDKPPKGKDEITRFLGNPAEYLQRLVIPETEADLAKLTLRLSVVSLLISFWIRVPIFYKAAILAGVAMPVASLMLMSLYKGVVTLFKHDGSTKKPNLFMVFVFPSIALGLRAASDYNVLSLRPALLPIILLTGIASFVVFRSAKDIIKQKWLIVFVIPVAALLSYGVAVQANCLLDYSPAVIHEVRVTAKNVEESTGRHRRHYYYIKTSPWLPGVCIGNIEVSKTEYDRCEVGGAVLVNQNSGLLNAPWYYVGQPNIHLR